MLVYWMVKLTEVPFLLTTWLSFLSPQHPASPLCREAFFQVLSLGGSVNSNGEELLEPLQAIPGPLSKANGQGGWRLVMKH